MLLYIDKQGSLGICTRALQTLAKAGPVGTTLLADAKDAASLAYDAYMVRLTCIQATIYVQISVSLTRCTMKCSLTCAPASTNISMSLPQHEPLSVMVCSLHTHICMYAPSSDKLCAKVETCA